MTKNDTVTILIGDAYSDFKALRQRFGGAVHVFNNKCRISVRLNPFAKYHRVSNMKPEILAMYLKSISTENSEKLAVVSASSHYSELLHQMASMIESYCIIIREDNLERNQTFKSSGADR